jgi:hypothetical protein
MRNNKNLFMRTGTCALGQGVKDTDTQDRGSMTETDIAYWQALKDRQKKQTDNDSIL